MRWRWRDRANQKVRRKEKKEGLDIKKRSKERKKSGTGEQDRKETKRIRV